MSEEVRRKIDALFGKRSREKSSPTSSGKDIRRFTEHNMRDALSCVLRSEGSLDAFATFRRARRQMNPRPSVFICG
jgi:hypothetical protein